MFVPSFQPRSHVVDVHLENFPGLEEAGWGPLEPSAPAKKHVVSDVALELCPTVIPLRQLSRLGYSGMAIGGVNKCQDAGYQGTGNG